MTLCQVSARPHFLRGAVAIRSALALHHSTRMLTRQAWQYQQQQQRQLSCMPLCNSLHVGRIPASCSTSPITSNTAPGIETRRHFGVNKIFPSDSPMERLDGKVQSGIWKKPPWYDLIQSFPPPLNVQKRRSKPKLSSYPEDRLLKVFLSRNPEMTTEPFAWMQNYQTISQRFAKKWWELISEAKMHEDDAYELTLKAFKPEMEQFVKEMRMARHDYSKIDTSNYLRVWKDRRREHLELYTLRRRKGEKPLPVDQGEDLRRDVEEYIGGRKKYVPEQKDLYTIMTEYATFKIKPFNFDNATEDEIETDDSLKTHREREEERILQTQAMEARLRILDILFPAPAKEFKGPAVVMRASKLQSHLTENTFDPSPIRDSKKTVAALLESAIKKRQDSLVINQRLFLEIFGSDPESFPMVWQDYDIQPEVYEAHTFLTTWRTDLQTEIRRLQNDKMQVQLELEKYAKSNYFDESLKSPDEPLKLPGEPLGSPDESPEPLETSMQVAAQSADQKASNVVKAEQVDYSEHLGLYPKFERELNEEVHIKLIDDAELDAWIKRKRAVVENLRNLQSNKPVKVEETPQNIIGYTATKKPIYIGNREFETPNIPRERREREFVDKYPSDPDIVGRGLGRRTSSVRLLQWKKRVEYLRKPVVSRNGVSGGEPQSKPFHWKKVKLRRGRVIVPASVRIQS